MTLPGILQSIKGKGEIVRFIKDNISLGKEVDSSKIAIEIAKKSYHTDEELRRFDIVQNKTLKSLQNYFYTLVFKGNLHSSGRCCCRQ